ncbi:hypothetical protein AAE026_34880 [Bradyrhizobium sp. DN5]|uniref:hypothetical protein n=1 Tax=Bradyrhizobium sp. DN5 TaxID=3056950 RepID=UPI003523F791
MRIEIFTPVVPSLPSIRCTDTIILSLILLQAAGWRRPVEASWLIGLPFGSMLGILYLVTTISGPPLAMLFNNQGLVKHEFRAGLALVRVAESSVTAFVYYQLGLFPKAAACSMFSCPVLCLASLWGPTSFAGLIRRYFDASA